MKIDIPKFLFIYEQEEFKTLTESAQNGLVNLLGFFEDDVHMNDIRWIAYCLSTVLHETAGTYLPIEEYGRGKGMKYGTPDPVNMNVYYGRGLTQNTWKGNYKMLTDAWNKAHPDRIVDFVKNPDLLLVMEYSYWAMSYAMRNGTYTGASLKKYIHDDVCDFVNARKIVNGLDCAEKIAGYAVKFEKILQEVIIDEGEILPEV